MSERVDVVVGETTVSDWQDGFRELQRDLHATAKGKGWHDVPRSFGESVVLVHSELSEAIEAYRDGRWSNPYASRSVNGKPEGVPSELADAIIRILDLAERYGIDLAAAIDEKHAFNQTRSYRHEGKRL